MGGGNQSEAISLNRENSFIKALTLIVSLSKDKMNSFKKRTNKHKILTL